jgi:hypothetical protein
MWIVRLALDRPYTFVVLAVLILLLGALFRSGPGGQDSGRKWTH